MAQTPKGRLVQGLYKPIHGTCAMYFYHFGCVFVGVMFLQIGIPCDENHLLAPPIYFGRCFVWFTNLPFASVFRESQIQV